MRWVKQLIILLSILLPATVQGAFTVPWNATSTTQGWISPVRINGVEQAVVSTYFKATSTTATSTGANGWNITSGCFSINNVCIGNAGGTLTGSGANTQVAFWTSASNLSSSGSFIWNGLKLIATNYQATGLGIGAVYTDSNGNIYSDATSSASVAYQDVWRDGNANIFANNFISGLTITTASGATTVLTPASTRYQLIEGSDNHTFRMPSAQASGMTVGSTWDFNNDTSNGYLLYIENHVGDLIAIVPYGGYVRVFLTNNSTPAGQWEDHAFGGHDDIFGDYVAGIGSTTPFGRFSIHANDGDSATNLFVIGSSTINSTTTLFSISNTGSTTASNGFNITNGCYAINSVCIVAGSNSGSAFEIATTTNIAVPQIAYFTQTGGRTTLGSVATGTISSSGGITTTANRSAIGGALSIACDVASSLIPGCLSTTDWTTFNSKQNTISVTWPITLSGAIIGFSGLSTTTNSGMSQGNLYVGSGGIFQTAASSSIFGYIPVPPTRSLTFSSGNGQLTWSAGAQDLTADRTWTVSYTGLATTTQPASSNLLVSNGGAGVYGVATSTLTATSPLAGSFTQIGSGGSISCPTCLVTDPNWKLTLDYLTPTTSSIGIFINGATSTITNLTTINSTTTNSTTTGTFAFTGTATSTFTQGINLSAGCFAINNACVSGAPGGLNTYIQYNDNSTFAGDSTFTFNQVTKLITLQNLLATASSTLQNFTFVNSTGTNATTTNLAVTTYATTSALTVDNNLLVGESGEIGVATSSPWAKLSIVGGTSFLSKFPIFHIATSSSPTNFTSIFSVFATSSIQTGGTVATNTPDGSGARIAIGDYKQYGFEVPLDELWVKDGRINTGEMQFSSCIPGGTLTSSTDSANVCGAEWYYANDSSGTFATAVTPNSGLPYIQLAQLVAGQANDGAGIFNQPANWMQMATNTPTMESILAINGAATNTQYYFGYVNTNPAGNTFEVTPTSGCYLTASSSKANWQLVSASSSVYVIKDTGIASTTISRSYGRLQYLRIEGDSQSCTALIKNAADTTLTKVELLGAQTKIPLTPGLLYGYTTAGTGGTRGIRYSYIRNWFRMPLANWPY